MPGFYDVMDSSKNEVVITGLEPDTSYSLQVAAYTRKGDGERSRAKTIKTKGAGRNGNTALINSYVLKKPEHYKRSSFQSPLKGPLTHVRIVFPMPRALSPFRVCL